MTSRDQRDDSMLIEVLKAARPCELELGPARLELERRRLMASLATDRVLAPRTLRPAVIRGLVAGAAAAAAAIVLALVFADVGGGSTVTLSGEWRLDREDAIARGTPVEIPPGKTATLVLHDGTRIFAAAETRMSFEDEAGSRIRLDAGHVVADVAPRAGEDRLEVATRDATVTVLGTFFSVRADDTGTVVRLHRGKVRLRCQDRTVAMEAGHEVTVGPDGLRSMSAFAPSDAAGDLALALGGAKDTFTAEALEPPSPIASADVPPAKEACEEASRETAGPATSLSRHAAKREPAAEEGAFAGDLARIRELWIAGETARVLEETEGVGLDPRILYFRAKALAATGRWHEAGETFGAVAGMSADSRPEALYLSARAFHRAGAFDRCLDMANLAVSVGGPNADHAWRLGFSALFGLRRYEDASAQATRYLETFPAGAHIAEAHFVKATGLRLAGAWEQAAGSYDRFLELGAGSPPMVDDAAYFVGYCELMAGQTAEGRRDLERYLAGHPEGKHAPKARAALAP